MQKIDVHGPGNHGGRTALVTQPPALSAPVRHVKFRCFYAVKPKIALYPERPPT